MPRPPDPHGVAGLGEPVVVVPEAADDVRTDALLAVVRWLAETRPSPPTVLCWQTGPRVAEFAEHADVIDAGAINEHLAARALAAVRLAPVARIWKGRRLRRLLEPLAAVDHVLLGGVATAPLLAWLPPRTGRTVAVWLGDDEADRADEALAVGTSFLVSGEVAAEALVALGAAPERLHRVGEPLLGAVGPPQATAGTGDPYVGVLGTGPEGDEGDDVVRGLTAAVLATAGRSAPAVVWVRGADQAAARWTDPRYAGLEAEVADWTLEHARHHLDELAALVVVGPDHRDAVVEAVADGVPTLALRPVGVPAVTVEPDPAALARRLTTLLADPVARAEVATEGREGARRHRLDEAGPAVLAALGEVGG